MLPGESRAPYLPPAPEKALDLDTAKAELLLAQRDGS